MPIAAKVGKSARRNLRFLHLPAPLPLMPTPNSALAPTVENVSGSDARGADDSSYVTITTGFCERAVKGIKYERRHSVGGFLNRRFKLSFWVLLGQRPKVPRPRRDETLPPQNTRKETPWPTVSSSSTNLRIGPAWMCAIPAKYFCGDPLFLLNFLGGNKFRLRQGFGFAKTLVRAKRRGAWRTL